MTQPYYFPRNLGLIESEMKVCSKGCGQAVYCKDSQEFDDCILKTKHECSKEEPKKRPRTKSPSKRKKK
jgi:hypothetical protein